jgi:4-amino-4-deoxy-L-arabinose transferase-like glycosyltransferase
MPTTRPRLNNFWNQLTHNKEIIFWIGVFAIYLLGRLPYLFMKHWNFDEGVYLSVASDLNYGSELYTQAWDHKPPLIYWLYALLLKLSANQYWIIPAFNFVLGAATVVLIYKVSEYFLTKKESSYLITFLAALIFGFGFYEAGIFNGENLFIPLILATVWLFLNSKKLYLDWIAGIFLALSGLTKAHAVVELVGFFGGYLIFNWSKFKQILIRFLNLGLGAGLVLSVTILVLAFGSDFGFSLQSIFGYNAGYIQSENSEFARLLGVPLFNGKVYDPDKIGVSGFQWRLIVFLASVALLILYRVQSSKLKKWWLLAFWSCFSWFAVMMSGRNYSHYFLQIIPILLILFGVLWEFLSKLEPHFKLNSNISKLLPKLSQKFVSGTYILLLTCFIWLSFGQFLIFIFTSGQNNGQISLDVAPVEPVYRDFYWEASRGNLTHWQEKQQRQTYWYYPKMSQIVSRIQELTPENERFWHYSNLSALCYYSQRQCGYTTHLWFHIDGEIQTQTLQNLNQNPPTTIFVDNTVRPNPKIQDFLQTKYVLTESLPDIFNGSSRYEFWKLKQSNQQI